MNRAWRAAVKEAIAEKPHRDTREITNHTFRVPNMLESVLTVPERNISYQFMAAEAYWIITGRNDLAFLKDYAPSYSRFSDDGVTLNGAYGPPFLNQIDYVVRCLETDSTSRQAVLTLWKQNPAASKDIPCTVAMNFYVRDGLLNLTVFMRSSDIWLGLPYDTYSFSCMGLLVAQRLGMHVGSLTNFATSRHLYNRNLKSAQKIATQGLFTPNDIAQSATKKPYLFNEKPVVEMLSDFLG